MNSITDSGVNYVAQMWNKQIGWAPEGFFIWDTITAVAITNPEFGLGINPGDTYGACNYYSDRARR